MHLEILVGPHSSLGGAMISLKCRLMHQNAAHVSKVLGLPKATVAPTLTPTARCVNKLSWHVQRSEINVLDRRFSMRETSGSSPVFAEPVRNLRRKC